jgi:flagellar motility protein MotE (MotC chaperone)
MFRKLITASLLILLSFSAYSQITLTDKGYTVTREFLEFTAQRFDSLKTYKQAYKDAVAVADSCAELIGKTEQLNQIQERNIAGLKEEIAALGDVVESYKRQEVVTKEIQKQLKKETRKRKFWQLVGIGTGAGLLTTILILAI